MNVVSQKFLITVRLNMIKGAPEEVNDHYFKKLTSYSSLKIKHFLVI